MLPRPAAAPASERSIQSLDRWWIALGLAISGAFAWWHRAAPTGLEGWDAVLRVSFAVVVPLAVGWAPRWAAFGALAVTGGLAVGSSWFIVAGLGMVLAVTAEVVRADYGLARAGIGVAVAHGLLNLRAIEPFGATALITTVVVGLCAITALAGRGQTERRLVTTFGGFAATLALLFSGLTGLALLQARADADAGSGAARRGLEAARDGDTVLATSELDAAAGALASADNAVNAWWVEPGRLIPVVGQHLSAARAATGPLGALVEASAVATEQADIEQLQLSSGTVDLALVSSMAEPLGNVEAAALDASDALDQADSQWLVPQARDLIAEASAELDEVRPEAQKAAAGVRVLPGMLGADGPQRYLVMFATPAEARELGGILGSFVELTVTDGRIAVTGGGSNGDLNRAGPGLLADPSAYPTRFVVNRPDLFSQNWTGMVDVPSVARAAGELYPTMGGRPIDGIVYVDPIGVAALLELAGPIELPEIGRTIDSSNVVEFLQVEQYRDFDDQAERKDFLTDIAETTFSRLLSADLPGPRQLGTIFGPAARGGHLQFATIDSEPHAFLESLFLLGSFPEPDGNDFLSVVHANGDANKLDSFLGRDLDYDLAVGDNGEVEAAATITLTADVPSNLPAYVTGTPPDGLPVGTNRVHLSIITGLLVEQVLVDGQPSLVEPQEELGYNRYLVFVDVPPQGTVSVTFELTGSLNPDQPYQLTLANQARINPDQVTINVRRGEDLRQESFELVEDTVIDLDGQ